MRKQTGFCLAIALSVLFLCPGCRKHEPTSEQILSNSDKIRTITKQVVSFGMKKWSEKNPELAAKVAEQLVKNIDEVIVPYLDESQGIASSVLEAAIQQKLLNGLPLDVQNLINLAAVVLDGYIPAPAPDEFLKDWQLAYMKAFFTGVSQGASEYAAVNLTRDYKASDKRGKWFKPKQQATEEKK